MLVFDTFQTVTGLRCVWGHLGKRAYNPAHLGLSETWLVVYFIQLCERHLPHMLSLSFLLSRHIGCFSPTVQRIFTLLAELAAAPLNTLSSWVKLGLLSYGLIHSPPSLQVRRCNSFLSLNKVSRVIGHHHHQTPKIFWQANHRILPIDYKYLVHTAVVVHLISRRGWEKHLFG